MKTTALIGANDNPEKYAYKAAVSLLRHGHKVILIGNKVGNIIGEEIITDKPSLDNLDTVTLYINAQNQKEWYNTILNWSPKRIIFNPGTENPEFESIVKAHGIEVIQGCTLVMLSIGNY